MSVPGQGFLSLPIVRTASAIVAVLGWIVPARADIQVLIERNDGTRANGAFAFTAIPPPEQDDAAARARVEIVRGRRDRDSGGLGSLTDGVVPGVWDDPGANFFFMGGTTGGCFRIDLGAVKELARINTYSWHRNTRGPQVYTLHGSDGTGDEFSVSLKGATDPAMVGWKRLATVDTRPKKTAFGGQYGVSITDSTGKLGKFRFLLFCCSATEVDDDFGNTFYSEVDVVAR